ncbi:hypothetical protein Leryth_018947, partial [Lithospermum erythrorhizon]
MEIQYPDYRSRFWRSKYKRLDDLNRKFKKVKSIKLGRATSSVRKARGSRKFPRLKLVSPIKCLLESSKGGGDRILGLDDWWWVKQIQLLLCIKKCISLYCVVFFEFIKSEFPSDSSFSWMNEYASSLFTL